MFSFCGGITRGQRMRYSLEEMVAFAIKYQPFILDLELEKGGTLTYCDEQGNYYSRYPDGHVEKVELEALDKDSASQ